MADVIVDCTQCSRTFKVSGSQTQEKSRKWPVACPYCNTPNEVDFPNKEGVFTVHPV